MGKKKWWFFFGGGEKMVNVVSVLLQRFTEAFGNRLLRDQGRETAGVNGSERRYRLGK